nr:hypothetical protein [Schwartzia sp. (in: firmicutes)]
MEFDLHNFAPVIGAVNAARKGYRFDRFQRAYNRHSEKNRNFKNHDRLVEPPDSVKELAARTRGHYTYFSVRHRF